MGLCFSPVFPLEFKTYEGMRSVTFFFILSLGCNKMWILRKCVHQKKENCPFVRKKIPCSPLTYTLKFFSLYIDENSHTRASTYFRSIAARCSIKISLLFKDSQVSCICLACPQPFYVYPVFHPRKTHGNSDQLPEAALCMCSHKMVF